MAEPPPPQQQPHERIVFDLEQQEQQQSELEAEREKHRIRAERFGAAFVDPASKPAFAEEARRQRFTREGFATGIDLFSEEEAAKRAARAAKFGLPPGRAALGGYGPDPEETRRAARAAKFGVAYATPTPEGLAAKADLYEPVRQAPADVPRREEAVYLYGVDLLSSRDVLAYFDDYGPRRVEWINDSSCCVVFADAATTRRAIAGSGQPLTEAEQAGGLAPDAMDVAMTCADAAAAMQYAWHKGRPFVKGKDASGKQLQVPLMYRMATDLDQKDPHADKRSRFLWKGGKRRLHDSEPQQQQGRRQRQQQQDGGWQDEPGGGQEGGDDVDMRPARSKRGGRRTRRQQQQQQEEGEAMQDAPQGGGTEAGAEAAGGPDLRGMLHRHGGSWHADDDDAGWIEVPQPDDNAPPDEELPDARAG